MISTKIYLSLEYVGRRDAHISRQIILARAIELPYKLTASDEVDLDDNEWIGIVEKARLNLKSMNHEAFLVSHSFENELERDDSVRDLIALGWQEDS